MEGRSVVGRAIDRTMWKLDRKRTWAADLRREAMTREREAALREAALRSEIQASAERISILEARLLVLEGAFGVVSSHGGAIEERLEAMRGRVSDLESARESEREAEARAHAVAAYHARQIAVLEQVVSSTDAPGFPAAAAQGAGDIPQVSVIMPVFNRRDLIGNAIDSVRAQDFAAWELVVVDDGSSEDMTPVVERYRDDARIRWIRQPKLGVAAARNAGLRQARGDLIAYLDSDNLWYPFYLTAMVAALADDPEADLGYGVLVTEAHGLGDRRLLFRPFDRDQLMTGNFIDMNVFVHRAKLVGELGGFDESLDRLVDWDLILRYTQDHRVGPVPVLGARYRVIDGQRITDVAPAGPNVVAIERKWYPPGDLKTGLRVVYVVWRYPQLSETYFETEIKQLLAWGVHIEVWREAGVAAPYEPSVPIHSGAIEDAVRAVNPEVIHARWLGFALSRDAALAAFGLPVTVRLHGFDTTREGLETLLSKLWLSAIYAFPAQAALLESADKRVKVVPAAFDTALFRPNRMKDRRLVVRAGTALPSKDVPFAFELAKMLPGFHVVYAGIVAKNVEAYVDELIETRDRTQSPIEIRWNVPRAETAALLGRAGVYLHTIDSYVGTAGRGYDDLDEAAAIIAETASWTEDDWSGAENRSIERAYRYHADALVYRTLLEDWVAIAGANRPARAEPDAAW